MATAFRIGRSRAPARQRISRADRATTRRASTASGPTTTSTTWNGWRASSKRRATTCRSRSSTASPAPTSRIIGYGSSHWAIEESRDQLVREAGRRPRLHAPARVSVHRGARGLHRSLQAHLRRRAEPRCADAEPDAAGAERRARREAAEGAPLQRAADRCAVDHRRDSRAGGHRRSPKPRSARAALAGRPERRADSTACQIDSIARPTPPKKTNRIGLEHSCIAAARRRSAQAAATTPSPSASSMRSSKWAIDPKAGHQAVRDRLFEQEPGVFPRRVTRIQHRPRPDAVGRAPARCSRTAS